MRLVLKLAVPWTETTPALGEGLAFTRGDLPARLHTTVLRDRFVPSHIAVRDGARVEVTGEQTASSALGWPVYVVDRVVIAPAQVPVGELDVRYTFLDMSASVVVTGPADAIAVHRDQLLTNALSGALDWSGDIACIYDLLM